jgi:hydroxymethylpyrimidine kinase/phosphomethylpyrimidine kinase
LTQHRPIPVALTIAGSDPSGGAGIQADLKTFAGCRVYGLSAIAAITAQNETRVARVKAIKAAALRDQLITLLETRRPDAIKTGALVSAENFRAVVIAQKRLPAPVVDPVMMSSSGKTLIDRTGLSAMRAKLFPIARVVTPNIPEAEALTGITITDIPSMREAARAIRKLGAGAVVIKGGHLFRDSQKSIQGAVDLLFDGSSFIELRASRLAGVEAHGTGCAFSAAAAAYLAQGEDLEAAVRAAKNFVLRSLRGRFALRPGGGMLLDHLGLFG